MPTIRLTTPADRPAVLGLVREAFAVDGRDGSEEVEIVERVWAGPRHLEHLDLVAVEQTSDGETVVGHVLVSRGAVDDRPALGLAPLAVAPSHQRQGVGTALTEAALCRADAAGEALVVLLGHPGYYPRFGFEPAAPLGLRLTWGLPQQQPEAFMARRLAAYDPSLRGTFRYAWELAD